MMPNFPDFKKIELSDRQVFEKFTSQYEPYSDFNFVDLWSWDIPGEAEFSVLNQNLIIKLNNFFTDQYTYSFLGNRMVNETIGSLFALLTGSKIQNPELILVPEVSLVDLDSSKYFLEIDLNSYDYIYDVNELSVYQGSKFSDKRRKLNGFLKSNPNVYIELMDLLMDSVKNQILSLNLTWVLNKGSVDEGFFLPKESNAVTRFLNANFDDLICVGVYSDNLLIGYSVFSILNNDFAICHFSKANLSYFGVYEYLMRESCLILRDRKVKYLNYQEDLGIPGLRFFKNSFKPCDFLRKFYVRPF